MGKSAAGVLNSWGSGRALSRALREIWQETVRRADSYAPGGEEGPCWDYCSFQASKRKAPASDYPIWATRLTGSVWM